MVLRFPLVLSHYIRKHKDIKSFVDWNPGGYSLEKKSDLDAIFENFIYQPAGKILIKYTMTKADNSVPRLACIDT